MAVLRQGKTPQPVIKICIEAALAGRDLRTFRKVNIGGLTQRMPGVG